MRGTGNPAKPYAKRAEIDLGAKLNLPINGLTIYLEV